MISRLFVFPALLALVQAPAPSVQPPGSAPAPVAAPAADAAAETAPPIEPWEGSVTEAFRRLREEAEAGRHISARLIADRLLAPNGFLGWKQRVLSAGGWQGRTMRACEPVVDWLRLDGLDEATRAEVWYARGVVDSLAKERAEAELDFDHARAQATELGLRHDAMYDLGVLALEEGEEAHAQIPEIKGQPPAPPPPVPPQPGGAEPPDPLKTARAAYLKARERFVERLRSDWRDVDTQKNVELCLKRLRELDEIEKQREEQKQKQEQQQKDKEKQDREKQDSSKQDPQQKQDQPDQQKQDPQQQDQPKPDEQKPEQKPEDKQPEPDKQDQAKPDEKKQPAQPPEAQEQPMSREEMTQLLDRLQQLEEEARKIQAQLKAARRGRVKKDW